VNKLKSGALSGCNQSLGFRRCFFGWLGGLLNNLSVGLLLCYSHLSLLSGLFFLCCSLSLGSCCFLLGLSLGLSLLLGSFGRYFGGFLVFRCLFGSCLLRCFGGIISSFLSFFGGFLLGFCLCLGLHLGCSGLCLLSLICDILFDLACLVLDLVLHALSLSDGGFSRSLLLFLSFKKAIDLLL